MYNFIYYILTNIIYIDIGQFLEIKKIFHKEFLKMRSKSNGIPFHHQTKRSTN